MRPQRQVCELYFKIKETLMNAEKTNVDGRIDQAEDKSRDDAISQASNFIVENIMPNHPRLI